MGVDFVVCVCVCVYVVEDCGGGASRRKRNTRQDACVRVMFSSSGGGKLTSSTGSLWYPSSNEVAGEGGLNSALAIYYPEEKAFVAEFNPPLVFNLSPSPLVSSGGGGGNRHQQSTTLGAAATLWSQFWYLLLRRLYITYASVSSDTTERLLFSPICVTCPYVERRLVGKNVKQQILDIPLLKPYSEDIIASSSLHYYPPPTSSNSALYTGPSRLESIRFRLEDLAEVHRDPLTPQTPFPHSAIRSGFLDFGFTTRTPTTTTTPMPSYGFGGI